MYTTDRRAFLKTATCVAAGAGFAFSPIGEREAWSSQDDLTIIGPKPGYAPGLGTLSSMMAFMRAQVVRSVSEMKIADLDFLLDAKANTIGAMLLHLAATEIYYQLNTFQGLAWGTWPDEVKQKWGAAMQLGDAGRKNIKGKELEYYLSTLKETRGKTLTEFKKRDDKWLFAIDKSWPWGPTNNYCKWFHVCEHEANHNGQIKFVKGRVPGAKETSAG